MSKRNPRWRNLTEVRWRAPLALISFCYILRFRINSGHIRYYKKCTIKSTIAKHSPFFLKRKYKTIILSRSQIKIAGIKTYEGWPDFFATVRPIIDKGHVLSNIEKLQYVHVSMLLCIPFGVGTY